MKHSALITLFVGALTILGALFMPSCGTLLPSQEHGNQMVEVVRSGFEDFGADLQATLDKMQAGELGTKEGWQEVVDAFKTRAAETTGASEEQFRAMLAELRAAGGGVRDGAGVSLVQALLFGLGGGGVGGGLAKFFSDLMSAGARARQREAEELAIVNRVNAERSKKYEQQAMAAKAAGGPFAMPDGSNLAQLLNAALYATPPSTRVPAGVQTADHHTPMT